MQALPRYFHPQANTVLLGAALLLAVYGMGRLQSRAPANEVLAGVEPIVVTEAGIVFEARMDTGAAISSVHAEDIEVIDGHPTELAQNRGKFVKFTLVNERKARARLKARIEEVQMIRTGDCREYRYHVYLTLAHRGRGQRVLVNLNDRHYSSQRMLIGRNWLEAGYVVDIRRDPGRP